MTHEQCTIAFTMYLRIYNKADEHYKLSSSRKNFGEKKKYIYITRDLIFPKKSFENLP